MQLPAHATLFPLHRTSHQGGDLRRRHGHLQAIYFCRVPNTAQVLEFGIESAVDLAAGAMEAMAGGVTSPRELGLQEGDHEG